MDKCGADAPESKQPVSKIILEIGLTVDPNGPAKHVTPKLQKTDPPLIQKGERSYGFWLTRSGKLVVERIKNARTK